MIAHWPRDVLAAHLTTTVAPGYPGAGRRVYPALLQLLAYSAASPQLYAEVQNGLLLELAAGKVGVFDRQHADIHSLADVPGELFLDTIDWVRQAMAWDEDIPIIGGRPRDLARLQSLPVLTLESEEDELVGQGQTHALTRRLRSPRARTWTVAGGRHHDLFTGPGFADKVFPVLRRFYAEQAG
jgi:poly(3-hydroxybutyrate) depolymerase